MGTASLRQSNRGSLQLCLPFTSMQSVRSWKPSFELSLSDWSHSYYWTSQCLKRFPLLQHRLVCSEMLPVTRGPAMGCSKVMGSAADQVAKKRKDDRFECSRVLMHEWLF